jgi:hypothetical protein
MMQAWNALKQPPDWAMKKITGGRLNGKSDISPMWRIQVLTEVFGMCGVGWKYEIVRTWTEDGDKGQKMIFRDINLYVKDEGKWSDAIPGTGGDMLIVLEKNGLYCNDEAAKMALTDALGNAMKNLGVAAVVYSNGIDGTKYNRGNTQPTPLPKQNNPAPAPPAAPKPQVSQQAKLMFALSNECKWTTDNLKAYIKTNYNKESSKDLTPQEISQIIDHLQFTKEAMQ